MKKIRLFAILFVMPALVLMGQSITVTSPNGGENWIKGSNRSITWSTSGISSGTYQITLWKGGAGQGVVATGLPHTQHSFNWTVGSLINAPDAAVDSGYTIKVRLQGEQPNDFSDGAFTITSPAPDQSITVTSPNGGENWEKGSSHNITWSTSGISSGTYQITLWKGGAGQGVVATGLPHTQHSFNWTVGSLTNAPDAAADSGFTIKVRLQGEQPNDFSDGPFTIMPAPTGVIKIIKPTSMYSFTAGGNMTIMWRTTGSPGNVNLYLVKADNSTSYPIKRGHPPDGSGVKWQIPPDLPGGKYFVRINETEAGGASAQSGHFRINQMTSSIHVMEPQKGVTKLKGKTCGISWHSTNISDRKVRIRLMSVSGSLPRELGIISGSAENREGRNRLSWTIRGTIPDGSYQIAIERLDGMILGESGEFDIAGSRSCDLAISSAEFCGGELKAKVYNRGDHYTGKITIMLIYDMFGRARVNIPVIVKNNFILFSGKTLELSEKNNKLFDIVQTCSMNYSLLLIPDKDHTDQNQANNQYNGVAYRDCDVRECNKPDIWFEWVSAKKKYHNSSLHAGQRVRILAELRKSGNLSTPFTARVIVYFRKEQIDQFTRITENRWRVKDFNRKKELSFSFTPEERGYYRFECMADTLNEVDERDENNNKKVGGEFIWEKL